MPLLEKDPLKELLFDTLGAGGRARSREIGGAAYTLLFDTVGRLLRGGTSLVVEANFAADTAEAEFTRLPSARFLQVYAFAPPQLVLERFTARAGTTGRHDGHADIAAVPEVEKGLASGRWRPLTLRGELVELDTSQPFDLEPIVERIRTLCA